MKLQFLLYVIIAGLVINLLSNMIWKYLPGTDHHLDKIVTVVLIGICIILLILYKDLSPSTSSVETTGVLLPDSAQIPPNPCEALPPDAMALFLGNSAVYTRQFPYTVFRVAGQDLLSIDKAKEAKEGISVSAKIFSSDRRIVAEIIKNKFHINPNNYFRLERPDKHSLVVYDQQATKVLSVYYLNPTSIKLLGIFHSPNRYPIVIEEDKQKIVGNFSRFCFADGRIAFDIK